MRIENSFIPVEGVGTQTEQNLWQQGITHWDAFDRSAVGPATGKRIEQFIDEAQSHLGDPDARFFDTRFPSSERWRLYENFRDRACFFDIETTGLDSSRNVVTTVSYHQNGDTTTLVRGDNLTAERIREMCADASLLVSFNGIRFDQPFLEDCFELSIETPHLDLMYPCKKLGLSGGLKPIEREIGIERDRPDISGLDAVRLWQEHTQGRDGSLETLVSYNREDAVNLKRLTETVTNRLHENEFTCHCESTPD
ncbi:ribonuclease H-like domain-containing protein [Natronocalculus amylovorans]|uniref:Ribonuclease H-like domain-containing protein n=1 Tax=Natronocalculus amylovorans TaxID=2917812 RepID=A0AAE3KB84_9EURY|nr:ribonuclease H-like domain-containing protein [Natronocalculus amylovorans]MCL9817289.1 ribonuclease H-like domain-containing protein [Natronocalculus amylovorans]NUE02685.1 ribonuclease H-like domain-containing protein [Halorubraceae archaeon YAN]